MKIKKIKKSNLIFSISVCLFCVLLVLIPTGFEHTYIKGNYIHEKAEIVSINDSDLKTISVVTMGTQDLNLKVLSGKFEGRIVKATNILMGQKKIDKIFKKGDKILAVLQISANGETILSARADDFYRIDIELILFLLFAVFLVSFAGIVGFKALLSFMFTALCFWKLLIPLYLKGYAPIGVGFVVVFITTSVIILLINGFTSRGFVALTGAVGGIGATTILALIFDYYFKIPGTVQEFSETILYAGFTDLRLSDIFIASIFISAAGAVMDIAMDISAAQNEIIEKKANISRKELMLSGFNVAYPVIGTMTTTLLFAYSGSFMFTFMVFMAKGTPIITIFNTNYVAAEILHTLVGSFGLVLVAPATAIIGGYAFTIKRKHKVR